MARETHPPEVTLLEALRVDRGLTAETVSREAGISHKTLKAYETARHVRPHAGALDKIARFYGVRTSVLLEDIRRVHALKRAEAEQQLQRDLEAASGLRDAA